MTMAPAVQRYLEAQGTAYTVCNHPLTQTAWETAHATHISGNRVAKAVVLREGAATCSSWFQPPITFGSNWYNAGLGDRWSLLPSRKLASSFQIARSVRFRRLARRTGWTSSWTRVWSTRTKSALKEETTNA